MRHALIALSAVAFIGCYGESVHPPDYPREEAGDEGTEVAINPEILDQIQTAELGTDRTRGIAKTIEWTGISTEVGATYHDDALTVIETLFPELADMLGAPGGKVLVHQDELSDRVAGLMAGYLLYRNDMRYHPN